MDDELVIILPVVISKVKNHRSIYTVYFSLRYIPRKGVRNANYG